jgi:hypothetical protein
VLRRVTLIFLCLLLAGNGPLELVRCETNDNVSLSLSFFGACDCHTTESGCSINCAEPAHEDAARGGITPDDCGCCFDTVVAELDPTLASRVNIAAPTIVAAQTVTAPLVVDCRTAQRIPATYRVPRSSPLRLTVLRI